MPIDASHFSMVGFPIEMTSTGMSQAAQTYLSQCAVTQLTPEDLVCLVHDPSGAELRIGIRKRAGGVAELETFNPAFIGEGRVSVEIGADTSDPDFKPYETTLSAHFAGQETPLVFDVANPTEATTLAPKTKAIVDLAAFSFAPEIYPDEAAFLKHQEGAKVRFAPDFFIPSGLFFKRSGGAMPDDAKRPVAYADFAGKVLRAKLRSNQITHAKFWWALVQTNADAIVDVVLDPGTVRGDLRPGEIVTGRFWLSAHIAPQPIN